MPFEFGDVVLVPFPFTDQSTTKQRPAVVISKRDYNLTKPDVVLMPITSQLRFSQGSEALVNEWHAAGLLKPSAIKPVFATLEQKLIIRQLGTLAAADKANLLQTIVQLLG